MKKEYVSAEVEIIKINVQDVITTSGGAGPIVPGETTNPFGGGYDAGGWT